MTSEIERVERVLAAAPGVTRLHRYQHDGGIALHISLATYASTTVSLDWDEVDDAGRLTRLHLERIGFDDQAILDGLYVS